ncbi:MAG: hypothetical protein JXX29_04220 [Deltaproteobacteria bacterium]|nr:hypothetical protein [Deltaproteobacteria bacterium]MBN2670850.1 hypothetical protein [Deltaproteobacteria bacterium]
MLKYIRRGTPPAFGGQNVGIIRGIICGIICLGGGAVFGQESTVELTQTEPIESASAKRLQTVEEENATLKADVELLKERLQKIEQQNEDAELEALIQAARDEAESPIDQNPPEERSFLWGVLALQKLNPEISVSADMLTTLIIDDEHRYYSDAGERSGFSLREVSLHVQHTLDPFSSFKGAIAFIPGSEPAVAVEEMYITWFGVIPSISITVGRFRQNFGVVNRWHAHDLDQTSYPLAMRAVLGDEGLAQTGVMMKWFLPPLWAHANELSLEVTNGENDTLLAGEFFSVPSVLTHLKNYWDINDNTYIEFGLSGMWGLNNKRGYLSENAVSLENEPWRHTWAGGVDLTLQWTPLQRAKYRSFTWRSEAYVASKERSTDVAFLSSGESDSDGKRYSFGVYSYLDFRASEIMFLGIRGDVALPTVRSETAWAFDIVPYITFWQSEFVYMRLEYAHEAKVPFVAPDGDLALRTDNRVMLQIDFAAGPHKHEKY